MRYFCIIAGLLLIGLAGFQGVARGGSSAQVVLGAVSNYDEVYVAEDYPRNGLERSISGGPETGFGQGAGVAGANGVAADGLGNVYVSGYADNTIWKYGRGGTGALFATATNSGATLQGLVCDGIGNVYAGDLSGEVLKFTAQGGITVLAELGAGERTTGVALDALGNVLVASASDGRIFSVRPKGLTNLFYQLPAVQLYGLAVDGSGNVYAADYGAGVVWKVASDGSSASIFATNLMGPVGLAFDHLGNLLVSEYDASDVVAVAPNGAVNAYATTAGPPDFMAVRMVSALVPVRTYSGVAQVVMPVTTPSGLTVNVTYNGSAQAPTNAGSYTVIGTIVDAVYGGSVTDVLTVVPAVPVISVPPVASGIMYGQSVGASTLSGGVVNTGGTFTFANGTVVPSPGVTNVSVIFTPFDTNDFTGVVTNVNLTVAGEPAMVVLNNLTQFYTGAGVGVGAATVPPGLAVVLTYNGSAQAPTNAGSYQVVGTIQDALYAGSVTNELDVLQATPVIAPLPTASGIAYGQTLAASVLSGGAAGTAGSFAFADGTQVLSPGVTNVVVVFTPMDTNDYTLASTLVPVVVEGPPVGANGEALVNPGQSHVFGPSDWGFSDPANQPPNHFTQVEIVTLPAVGSLTLNGLPVVAGQWVGVNAGLTYAPPAEVSGPAYAAFTFLVGDDGLAGANVALSPNTFTLNAGLPSQLLLGASVSPSVYGGSLFFTVTNLAADAGGSVVFAANGVAFSTNAVAGGVVVSGVVTKLAAGTNLITAAYAGDVNHLPETTNLVQVVAQAVPLITAAPRASGITAGQTLAASLLRGGAATTAGVFGFTNPALAPAAGVTNVGVIFTPADTNDYLDATTNVLVAVGRAVATVSLGPVSNYDNIYVAEDYPTNGVERYSGTSGLGASFGMGGGPGGANGVAVDVAGNVYVSGYADNTIWKYSPGGIGGLFATATNAGVALQGLAVDGQGNVYAGDLSGEVLKFDSSGVETDWCRLGARETTTGVAADGSGNMFVASETDGKIFIVGTNGVPALFYQLPAGALYGLAVDGTGNIYAADYGAGVVWKVASNGSSASIFATNLMGPVGLAFDHLGNLLVSEYDGRAIVTVATNGTVSGYATTGTSGANFLAVQTVAALVPVRTYSGAAQVVTPVTTPSGLNVSAGGAGDQRSAYCQWHQVWPVRGGIDALRRCGEHRRDLHLCRWNHRAFTGGDQCQHDFYAAGHE